MMHNTSRYLAECHRHSAFSLALGMAMTPLIWSCGPQPWPEEAYDEQASALYYTGSPNGNITADLSGQWPAVGRQNWGNDSDDDGVVDKASCTMTAISSKIGISADHCNESMGSRYSQFNWVTSGEHSGIDTTVISHTHVRHSDRVYLDNAPEYHMPCTSNAACGTSGLVCVNGVCGGCTDDSDCSPGLECIESSRDDVCRDPDAQTRRSPTDIALLRLSSMAPVSPQPVMLSFPGDSYLSQTELTIVGATSRNTEDVQTANCDFSVDAHNCPKNFTSGVGSTFPGNDLFSATWPSNQGVSTSKGDSGGPIMARVNGAPTVVGVNKNGDFAPLSYAPSVGWILSEAPELLDGTVVYLLNGQLHYADSTFQNPSSPSLDGFRLAADTSGALLPVSGSRNQSMTRAFTVVRDGAGRTDVFAVKSNRYLYHWYRGAQSTQWIHETVGYNVSDDTRPFVVPIPQGGFLLGVVEETYLGRGNVRLHYCNESDSAGGQGACGSSASATSWESTSLSVSMQDLDNFVLAADHQTATRTRIVGAAIAANENLLVQDMTFYPAGGSVSTGRAVIRDQGVSKTAGLEIAGDLGHRVDMFYANRTGSAVRRLRIGGDVSTSVTTFVAAQDIKEIIAAESSSYRRTQLYPRQRRGVWYVADNASGSSRLMRTLERETAWGAGQQNMVQHTYATNILAGVEPEGFSISSTGYRGWSEAFQEDHAFILKYDGRQYTRNLGSTQPDTTFKRSHWQSELDQADELKLVTSWSVHHN